MRSQWASVMCAIAVLHREHTYSLAFRSAVFSGKLAASFRYVDNCLWVDVANRGNTFASKQFWRLDFYMEPILLEDVPDFDALGFNLNHFQLTVSAQLPWNSTIRTSHTAGPLVNMFAVCRLTGQGEIGGTTFIPGLCLHSATTRPSCFAHDARSDIFVVPSRVHFHLSPAVSSFETWRTFAFRGKRLKMSDALYRLHTNMLTIHLTPYK